MASDNAPSSPTPSLLLLLSVGGKTRTPATDTSAAAAAAAAAAERSPPEVIDVDKTATESVSARAFAAANNATAN
eukprot:2522463-Ditylum_brightwellii.AAC.1